MRSRVAFLFVRSSTEKPARSKASFHASASATQPDSRYCGGYMSMPMHSARRRPSPAPVATAPVAPPPSDYTVYFDLDSWTLTAEDLAVITNVINTARAGGQSHITIVGHTDTSGSAGYNKRLSVRRAKAVAGELVRDGVPQSVINIQGFGDTHLLVSTGPGVREPQNRRVEIIIR